MSEPPRDRPLPIAARTDSLRSGSADAWALNTAAVQRQRAGEDIINVTVGDPDFDTPTAITDAAIESLRRGETHYSPAAGLPELREAIQRSESRRLGWEVPIESIVCVEGAQHGLFAVMQSIVNPGDDVLSIDPAYPTFPAVIGAAGGSMVRVPLRLSGSVFEFDVVAAEAAITPASTAFLLNFPHNPTGAILSAAAAAAVVEFCDRHRLWLICDEVYADLVFEDPHVSPLSLPQARDLTISIRSMSKSHAMSGWRVGWTIAPLALTEHILNAVNAMIFGSSEFRQRGAIAGLANDLSQEMRIAYQRRAQLVVQQIQASPHLKIVPPQSGIFALIDVRETGLTDEEFAWRLLREKDVAVMPASSFSKLTAGFIRVALCRPDGELAIAAERIVDLADEIVRG